MRSLRLRWDHRQRRRLVGRPSDGRHAAASLLHVLSTLDLCRGPRRSNRRVLAAFQAQTDPSRSTAISLALIRSGADRVVGEALYQRLFAEAVSQGCQEVLAVTAPTNRGSIAFHTRMGPPLPGPCSECDVPFTPAYDGPGEDRVRFRKPLLDPTVKSPSTDN